VTEQLLDTSGRRRLEPRSPSKRSGPARRNGHGEVALIALEPSEPSRRAIGRLRHAVAARAAIRHPNLVPARIIGEGDGRLFVAFVGSGHPSLSEVLAAGALKPAESALLLRGAAAGVAALSHRGLVPRDLKLDRVLVDPVHGAVLMDVGIPPELLRSPLEQAEDLSFRSPEELAGEPIDVRSSVYSLGAILATALAGVPRSSERGSELSPALEAVVARATAADAAERYPDPETLLRAFTAAAGLGPESLGQRAQTAVRANGHRRKPHPERTAENARSSEARAQRRSAERPRGLRPVRMRPAPRRRAAQSGLRSGVAAIAALLAVVGAAAHHGWSGLHRLALSVANRAKGAARWGGAARLRRNRLVLPAAVAIAASALSGIALGRAVEPDKRGPSSITRSGLTVQLPPGWEPARVDPARRAFSPAIAAAASDGPTGGLVVGKLSSQTAAEQMLERNQDGAQQPTQVRLGRAYAWRYAGLRPRPRLVGVGYVVPIPSGAVVMLCHASQPAAAVRLAECGRAATTLTIPGAPTHRLPFVDRFAERLSRVVAALRVSRSHGLRRLAAAKLPFGQARAATSLERSHERAAESLDRLDDGRSLGSLIAALRAAADAYGGLGHAAETQSRAAYRAASHAVAREEKAVRREPTRAGAE
jgi:hypothetical protein